MALECVHLWTLHILQWKAQKCKTLGDSYLREINYGEGPGLWSILLQLRPYHGSREQDIWGCWVVSQRDMRQGSPWPGTGTPTFHSTNHEESCLLYIETYSGNSDNGLSEEPTTDKLFTPSRTICRYLYIVHTFLPPKKGQPLTKCSSLTCQLLGGSTSASSLATL